jgi:enamine deaminase RidA (YjgF/YER057c/UK114 family)
VKSVLSKIARELADIGLSMADVVKMNVFLVGDPAKGGATDFEGLMN